jgi:hypothetical protein
VVQASRIRAVVWALTTAALLYSGAHFLQSGVVYPLQKPNLGKFDEEGTALRQYLRTGEPVHFDNAVQYGPVFFFVVHPLLLSTHTDRQLADWLYAIQIVCLGLGFLLTCATLKPFARERDWPLLAAWLAVLWLNFAPVYMTIAVKSVENWELLLLSLALYAYVRDRLWTMAFAVAAAALIKVLPLIFFYYLLVTNRRAFARAAAALLVLLLIGHAIYGPQMGLGYLPHVAKAAVGNSYGLTWHENVSLKAAAAKLFGRLQLPNSPYLMTLTSSQLRAATILGDAAVLVTIVLLTLTWLRGAVRSAGTIVWEWSLVSVVMLIVSPNTTFEYATLALGALSYAIVRLRSTEPYLEPHGRTWFYLGASMFFLGVLLPRQVLNRVTFVSALSRYSGYSHLSPSEAYQFYCFPLLGLILLTAALWRLRPVAAGFATSVTEASSASEGSARRDPNPQARPDSSRRAAASPSPQRGPRTGSVPLDRIEIAP